MTTKQLDSIYHGLLVLPKVKLEKLAGFKPGKSHRSQSDLASKILVKNFGERAQRWLNS